MPLTEQEEFELMELERQYALEMEREAQSATPSEPEKPSLGKQISKRGEQFAESVMGVPRYTMERPGVVERAAGAAGAVGGIVGDLGGAVLSPVISAGAKGASEASKITWLKKLSDAGRFLPVVQSAYALPDLAKMAGDVKLPSGLKAKEVPGEFVRGITPMVKESVKNIPEGEKRFYGDILDASNLVGLGIGETAIKKLADVAAKKSLAKTFAKKGLSEVVEQAPIISKKMIRQEGIKQTKGKGGVVGAIFNQYQITPQQVAALTDPKAPATIPLTKYARQERLHLAPPIGKIYQPNAGELAGSQATRAMNDLDLLRKIKGQELEKLIAKNADTPIDLTDIKAKYADDLAKVLGAQVEKTTTEQGIKTVVKNIPSKTVLMPGYSGKITQAQNLLDSVGDITNVGQAQYLKRALNQLTWDKTAAGYAKNTEMDAIIKPLIRELDNKINSLIPDAAYRKINSEYGQIKNVYDNFYKRVGPSLGIAFETAEEDIGRHAMSVMKRAVESGQDSNIRTIFQNVSQLLPEYDLMQDAHYASIVMKAMGDTKGIPLHQNLANAVLGRSVPQQAFEATKKGISGMIDPLTNIEKLWIKEQARKGGFNQVVYPTNDLKKMLDELRANKIPTIKREIKKVSFENDLLSGGGSALGIMGLPALREPSPAGYDAATQALLRTGAGGAAGMGASLALDKDATPQEHVGRGLAGALAGFGAPGLYRMAKSGFREGPFGAKAGATGSVDNIAGLQSQREGLIPAILSPSGKLYTSPMGHKDAFNRNLIRSEPENEKYLWNELFKDNIGGYSDNVGFIDKKGNFITRREAEQKFERNSKGGLTSLFHDESGQIGARTAKEFKEQQVRSPEFKRWFGDWENAPEKASKVVDKSGQPIVVYHGSPTRGIREFDTGSGELNYNPTNIGYGNFFTNIEQEAKNYARRGVVKTKGFNSKDQGTVYKTYLDIKNPYKTQDFQLRNAPDLDELIESGYDGIIIDNYSGTKWYIPFSPAQIKSATGNSGAFSSTNPDIRGNTALPMLGLTGAGAGGLLSLGAMAERAMNKKKGSK